ncbi:MAG TPA: UDP-N-acetylglucosamine 1-carboxyvinyltransferase [Firmicutes bacterium]|nr:UDP-N-acetylglucosamine 1-carboxyvinyltransferase [Bacillota bacterium]
MMKLKITGGRRLEGSVKVSGAKNSILKVMAASLLADGCCIFSNAPMITDVSTMIGVLQGLGAKARAESGRIVVDPSSLSGYEPPEELVREMRASIQVMGPLLARLGRVRVRQPGGCDIGPRPIDLHLKGFSALGAKIKEERGFIIAEARKLVGAEIHLDLPSVGATENIMMAACFAEGTTIIHNAAREPEIVDQQNFLNRMGARIIGAGTDTIKVRGVRRLEGIDYTIIPDRIEAGTYMCAIAITGGAACVENVIPEHLQAVISKLREAGIDVQPRESSIWVSAGQRPAAISVRSMPYPGFPTDMQPQVTALMSIARGTSIISETIFPNRFRYVDELHRMGANIKLEGRVAVVEGVESLTGADVEAPDLRGGAALILGALAADGETEISGVQHIDRGYEDIVGKLRGLGADIRRVG